MERSGPVGGASEVYSLDRFRKSFQFGRDTIAGLGRRPPESPPESLRFNPPRAWLESSAPQVPFGDESLHDPHCDGNFARLYFPIVSAHSGPRPATSVRPHLKFLRSR